MSHKILLIEDSKTILEVLTYAFENIGFSVISTSSEDISNTIFDKNNFDLIIIDIDFTNESVLKKTKLLTNKTDIFIISSNSDIQKKIEYKNNGVTGWIKKPFIPEKLALEIKNFLK